MDHNTSDIGLNLNRTPRISPSFLAEDSSRENHRNRVRTSMAVDRGTFETLVPSQFISFTFPNPDQTQTTPNPYGDPLRIAVLDSPVQIPDSIRIAAMLVPEDRQDDWIFSTEAGHLQLLSSLPGISRLILAGNVPRGGDYFPTSYSRPVRNDTTCRTKFEESLTPIILALSPKISFENGIPQIPFLTYEDNVIRSVTVERCIGSCVGEMLVEDVEIEDEFPRREFRRRLRFKRMPNLIQTETRIVSVTRNGSFCISLGEVEFLPETSVLVHQYLPPMVASLSLIAPHLERHIQLGSKPRVLCVGVGGGALLTFLHTQLGFEVMGVEADEMVLRVARLYFGLLDNELFRVSVGDGIEVLEQFAQRAMGTPNSPGTLDRDFGKFDCCVPSVDVIMVDLDSGDARNGSSAPPLEFVRKPVLLAARSALHKFGVLVINVIPLSKSFYDGLICEFREVFSELYEIDVRNGENYILIATASPIGTVLGGCGDSVLKKLKAITGLGAYMDSIKKI
ncbi:hypothetical protein HHK36_016739 [Tetracentron sinense]|uniref:Methyltransferase-like protein 13 n=1 Tax=Tetracentron sinense TaxID=13715 RepID=A0A834Z1V3_TETSI|nr:hypothetical protein HHK36_016739 [Tetracentron sinense]